MTEKLDWEELSKTREWALLNDKQRLFVATYISNGYNPVNAVRTAYKCKSDMTANIMSYRLLKSFNVIMCLSRHYGDDPKETFLNTLAKEICRGKLDQTHLRAYQLYAEIQGWYETALVKSYKMAQEMGYGKTVTQHIADAEKLLNPPTKDQLKASVDKLIKRGKKKRQYNLEDYENTKGN